VATISCPRCSAQAQHGGFPAWQWIVAICFFPIGLLAFLAGRNPSTCSGCGYSWTTGTVVTPLVVEHREIRSEYVQPPPLRQEPSRDVYAELMKLDELKSKGILTQDEFEAQKKKLLST
jgi:hypothetical protein